MSVVIGRPPDPVSRHSANFGVESSPVSNDDSFKVDIDLGPSKLVSRFHAELFYAMEDQKWHVEVKGRNGAQLNDQRLLRDQVSVVSSGDVLEIGGTQMMFVTADGQASIHPMFLEQIGTNANGDENTRPATLSHSHPETSYSAAPSSSSKKLLSP